MGGGEIIIEWSSYVAIPMSRSLPRCEAARYGPARCGPARCGAARCGAVRCGPPRCGPPRCGPALYLALPPLDYIPPAVSVLS